MHLYFEFCTFKILFQNTLQIVNLMRSLMADRRIDIAGVIRPGDIVTLRWRCTGLVVVVVHDLSLIHI